MQVSRAFKAATLDQRIDPRPFPDFTGGTFRISNPDLSPQRAATVEAGLSQKVSGGRWEAVVYRTTVEDEIDFDPATFRYRNIGRSLHTGLEASVGVFEGGTISPHASYAWTRVEATTEGRRGLQLKNVPEHLLRGGLRARLPGRLRADVRVTWSARRWLDDANRFPAGEARVVDVRLDRTFGRLRVRLDALNLLDHEWEPVGFTLSDLAGGVVPYALPAAPRALRAGVEWAF
jgi:outer membrane receptor protein involved in Fe transport